MFANKFEMHMKENTIFPLGVLWSDGWSSDSIYHGYLHLPTSNDYKTALKTDYKISVI